MKFELPESTAKVLSTSNCIVNIEPAVSDLPEECSSSDFAMNTINKLNDDCLRDIFWHFSLKELGIVADVCVRFRELAQELFTSKFNNSHLNEDIFSKYAELEPVLRNFGSKIDTISLDKFSTSNQFDVLTLIYQFCRGLKSLILTNFVFPDHLNASHLLFGQLEQLMFIGCRFSKSHLECILSQCTKLRLLDFDGCVCEMPLISDPHVSDLPQIPQLFHAWFNRCIIPDADMSGFISSQKTLKSLSIVKCFTNKHAFKTIYAIGAKMKELEALEFDEDQNQRMMNHFMHDAICITDEPFQLKSLEFNCSTKPVTQLLQTLVEKRAPIKRLKLKRSGLNSDEMKYIIEMKQIEVLDIFDCNLIEATMKELATSLPNLQKLHLTQASCAAKRMRNVTIEHVKNMLVLAERLTFLQLVLMDGVNINVKEYDELLAIIKKRQERSKLVIRLLHSSGHLNVPEAILLQNRDILDIKEYFLFQCPILP